MSRFVRGALLVVAAIWWAPTIVLVTTQPALYRASFLYRVRRAERLLEAGYIVEADRVIARLRWEAERYRRRLNSGRSRARSHGTSR